jgi:arylsulfatase A-like enzyme
MTHFTRTNNIALVSLALPLVYLFPESAFADERAPGQPNVVLIMTDDQGYGDLSCHGNRWLKTPNLDKLASQGIRLDDYHVSPYCVPTRAALLTGRYADRTGIHNVLEPHWFVRTNEVMLSNMFQDAGYATGMFGKWHLGDNYPYGPESRGFNEVLRHYGGAVGVLADYWDNCYVDDTYYHNGKPTKTKGYCTDVFFSAATQFIESSVEQDKPFFVYLATNSPHYPLICPPSYSKPYTKGKTRGVAQLYGMIANIDENVGRLRKFLSEKGIDKNTIFIFAGDNGTGTGHTIFNAGMRGRKMSPYDGGHRVPFFLHWPEGGFAKERRIETLTAHIDIAPTLLDLCGISLPDGVKFDGVSLRPLLEKGDHQGWPDRIIMTDSQNSGPPRKWLTTTVMSERWRLVDGRQLYDIDADPSQATNVHSKHPEVVARLSAYYDELWADIEPTFKDIAEIPLGDPRAKSVALNYHDCMARHMFWYQDGIRRTGTKIVAQGAKRPAAFWPVNVVADGEYTVELRRWPKELGAAIHADVPPGEPVYGRAAQRTTPGVGFPAVEAILDIGKQRLTEAVSEDDAGVTFRVKLAKGSQRLSARFVGVKGNSLDVYYVYVTRAD